MFISARYTCDPGWVLHGAFCYKFNDQRKTWFNAQAACKATSSSLATILTSDVASFLYSKLRRIMNVKLDSKLPPDILINAY